MRAFGLILVAPLTLALAGCELIAAVDHDLIGSGGSGAGPSTGGAGGTGGAGAGPVGGEGGTPVVGGMGGEGGSGGAPECTTPERCADPPVCQTVECNNENCEPGDDVADGTDCEISAGVDGVCFVGTAAAGDGSCVECLIDDDCQGNDTCDTATHQCEGPLCSNGVQNVGETGIDCGGPSCAACDNTQACLVATDCLSGFCNLLQCDPCAMNNQCAGPQWCDATIDGGTCVPDKADGQACVGGGGECLNGNCNPVGGGTSLCCDVPCAGTCRSCGAADTGGTNGTCDDILINTDPKAQCNTVAGDCNSGDCSGGTGCGFKPAAAACDDGQFCTDTDTCTAGGACTGAGNPCAGHDMPTSCNDSCDEGANMCNGLDAVGTACDEDADLTNGTCDAAGDCLLD